MAQQYASSIAAAQQAAGVEPLGLIGFPGLHDLREGDPTAGANPQPVDFYSRIHSISRCSMSALMERR
jgi:hypothetical protein